MFFTRFNLCIALIFAFYSTYAQPDKLRAVFTEDPSTKISIIFNTNNSDSTNPWLYYSTNRAAVENNTSSVAFRDNVLSNEYYGMYNNFVKLSNLLPGTKYYFKIIDSTGETPVYYFETIPDHPNERLSFIGGGDSRSNKDMRTKANIIVSKLKPNAVFFDGDFTGYGTNEEWQEWLENWQLTISSDGRITPLVPARGNREANNKILTRLFGTNSTAVYSLSFGGNLFKAYTLNSEITSISYASQTVWLRDQLQNDEDYFFKFAQYHKPMRPHSALKIDGAAQYAYWSPLFQNYKVDLVLEGDVQTASTTYPIVPCTGGFGCEDGFKEDAVNGTVYTGQGGWGAPQRPADDNRSWTYFSKKMNQFNLFFVDKEKIELRTIDYESTFNAGINEVNVNDRFNLPTGLVVEPGVNKLTGAPQDVLIIPSKKTTSYPKIEIAYPNENSIYYEQADVDVVINSLSSQNEIGAVIFYLNGVNIGLDNSKPFSFKIDKSNFNAEQTYEINAIAYNINGIASPIANTRIKVFNNCLNTVETQLKDSFNDAEELPGKRTDVSNFDLDMGYNETVCGIRFTNVNLPPNVTIIDANIQFTADEIKFNTTDLIFYAEDNAHASEFLPSYNNISDRQKTPLSVNWNNVPNWDNVGDSGVAQKTPNLKNIVQYMVNKPDWNIESPLTFIIEGEGYRVSETFDSDPSLTPVLYIQYACVKSYEDNFANVWPGDADSSGQVNAKDVLYICLADGLQGYSRPYASSNWNAQPLLPWPGHIAGVNNAYQDTDGNGQVNLNDIQVVDLNYGKQVERVNPNNEFNNSSLVLKQVSLSGDTQVTYDLVLNANKTTYAHGITGSIDLSNYLLDNEDVIEVHPNLKEVIDPGYLFNADVVFTKYNADTKTLDFAISKTDKVDAQIDYKVLLRIIIVMDEIEGNTSKYASIKNSGLINEDGQFRALKTSLNSFVSLVNTSNISKLNEDLIDLNLVTQNKNCNTLGVAEICNFNVILEDNISLEWSNGSTANKIAFLEAGNYNVKIKYQNSILKTIAFTIENDDNFEDQLIFNHQIANDGKYIASNNIDLNEGTEINRNQTVEFTIENCD